MVVPVTSVDNCILGHPTLVAVEDVTSTMNLMIKYHSEDGDVVTIYTNLDCASKFYKAFQKLKSASILKPASTLKGS